MTNCSKSKCVVSIVAVALFIFFYDFIVHGIILHDAYVATSSLWRPESEMQSLFWLCIVIHLALAVVYTALYKMTCKSYSDTAYCTPEGVKTASINPDSKKPCPMKRGACFGVVLGLLLAVMNGAAYMHVPIPVSLAISWFFAGLFQGVGVGILLATINNKKGCTVNG